MVVWKCVIVSGYLDWKYFISGNVVLCKSGNGLLVYLWIVVGVK